MILNDGVEWFLPPVIEEANFLSDTLQVPRFLTKLGESFNGDYLAAQKYFNYGEGVMIGVCDTGIAKSHLEVGGELERARAKDFSGSSTGTHDVNGHGTHVAHHIASKAIGLAPKSEVRIAKVLGDSGSGSSVNIANGVKWIVEEFKKSKSKTLLINMSLGGGYSSTIHAAIKNAVAVKGVIFFTAMGNSGGGGYTGNTPPQETGGYPGRVPETFGVVAVDYNERVASFSSRSVDADIAGFGVSVLSCGTEKNQYRRLSGTSMATPCECGLAALIIGKLNTLTNAPKILTKNDYLGFVKETMIDLGRDGKDMEYGYGKIQVNAVVKKITAIGEDTPIDEPVDEPIDEPVQECPPSKETRYFLTPRTRTIKETLGRDGQIESTEIKIKTWQVYHKDEKTISNSVDAFEIVDFNE